MARSDPGRRLRQKDAEARRKILFLSPLRLCVSASRVFYHGLNLSRQRGDREAVEGLSVVGRASVELSFVDIDFDAVVRDGVSASADPFE